MDSASADHETNKQDLINRADYTGNAENSHEESSQGVEWSLKGYCSIGEEFSYPEDLLPVDNDETSDQEIQYNCHYSDDIVEDEEEIEAEVVIALPRCSNWSGSIVNWGTFFRKFIINREKHGVEIEIVIRRRTDG